jgi:hypothetical protein
MFEYLDEARFESAIPAGHYAIQYIRQWAAARAGCPLFEGLSHSQTELAKRIIAEIEMREGKSVLAIPQAKIQDYIRIVSEKLQSVTSRAFHADAIKGAMLLNELRHVR